MQLIGLLAGLDGSLIAMTTVLLVKKLVAFIEVRKS
jgi:hypothetical protein